MEDEKQNLDMHASFRKKVDMKIPVHIAVIFSLHCKEIYLTY